MPICYCRICYFAESRKSWSWIFLWFAKQMRSKTFRSWSGHGVKKMRPRPPLVRTRSLNCENWNYWCFYVLANMKTISDLWHCCFSSCCIRDISWFEWQKCMTKPYHIHIQIAGKKLNNLPVMESRNQVSV